MTFTPIIIGSGLVGYNHLVETRTQQETRLAETPQVQRITDSFAAKLPDIKTASDLVNDREVLTVVLGAFGLQDHIDNRGLVQRILESDHTDEESLANTFEGGRFLALAETFNFSGEGGPNLDAVNPIPEAVSNLDDFETADELLNSGSFEARNVLKAALKHFDLEQYAGNRFFLQQVLESDPADPRSFVNQVSDKKLVKLAEAFNLKEKQANSALDEGTIYAFNETLKEKMPDIKTADDLLNDDEFLQETLDLFGIGDAQYRLDYLRDVLNSDLSDPNSVANLEEDKRYWALANAFEFPDRIDHAARIAATPDGEDAPAPYRGRIEKMIEAVDTLDGQLQSADDYFENFKLLLATEKFFGLEFGDFGGTTSEQQNFEFGFLKRVLNADLNDPLSAPNRVDDKRFLNVTKAFNVPKEVEDPGYTYPEGFAELIIEKYHSEEFLTTVGDTDPSMRYALGFEKGMKEVIDGGDNDSHWFSIIASIPLREVFQTVLQLPDSFINVDLDQQVSTLKERAIDWFGTDNVTELGTAPLLDEIRERYIGLAGTQGGGGFPTGNGVLLPLF